jgi:hypothetical protein
MLVWLGGAYTVVNVLNKIHGYISIEIVCKYLIVVCVVQCILAYSMTIAPFLKNFVDSFLGGEDAFMGKAEGRLYGIGAALDVAGQRFSAVLVMLAVLTYRHRSTRTWVMLLYVMAFFIIAVIGNMIARTTTIGVSIALLFWVIYGLINRGGGSVKQFWGVFGLVAALIIPIIVYQYNIDPAFKEKLRFGFEGFFSLAETGKWETSSNDILLEHMIVFPESTKTWLIGDGYGANPAGDPYYIGPHYHGFYMGTDIGYLRFLFYFGIFGLMTLVSLICYTADICVRRFQSYRTMFLLILAVNLIVWFKVSTDIFMVFALFLCISQEDNDAYENSISDPLDI